MPAAAVDPDPIGDWVFVPKYVLSGKAENYPGPRILYPESQHGLVEMEPAAVMFQGAKPTERLINLLPSASIPHETFTYELWISHHVNRPVCALLTVRGREPGSDVPVTVGFHDWESFVVMQDGDGGEVQFRNKMKPYGGYKERWVHLVLTYDGHTPRMFVNGSQVAQGHLHHDEVIWPKDAELEFAAYMQNEPFMMLGNLLHSARVYDEVLSETEIGSRFAELKRNVDNGILYPNLFHYTAGPYLNYVTETSMSLTWETDRPSGSIIEWGRTSNLENSKQLPGNRRLHAHTIEELEPGTPYFYRVRSRDDDGNEIDTGILTFGTAVRPGNPVRFAVLGDTEARPHINDRLAKLMWGERPNFVVNLGDLTDAGEQPHRYEWTHEYFLGMTQLASRIPLITVPGNGESDLHWFKHYHNYPGEENFYKFSYGDVTFFMLDSNRRAEEFQPGGRQYIWLEEQLSRCESRWKFVCHHHATYTSEEDDYGDSWNEKSYFGDPAVRTMVPLYEKYFVDIAMFGHLHLYERSRPIRNGKLDLESGTIHLLAGGGGGNLEDFAPTPAFFSAKTHRGHHYVTFEAIGNSLQMRMYSIEGALLDSFTLTKTDQKTKLRVSPTER